MEDKVYTALIRCKPINYNGLKFYPLSYGTIEDEIGLDILNDLLVPTCIDKSFFDIDDDELQRLNLFEDLILKNDKLLKSFGISLQIFCKAENVLLKNNVISVMQNNNEFVVDKDNFTGIAEVIRLINNKSIVVIEKPSKNLTERQLDIWKKLQEGRARVKEKNKLQMRDILNICEFGGRYHISIEEIEKWSLWKIMNCYNAITGMNIYLDDVKIAVACGDGKRISGENHWQHKLMIRE